MVMASKLDRIWRHANVGTHDLHRAFPADVLEAITAVTREIEARQAGEICFAIEDSLPLARLWRGVTPRERAVEVFARLGIWDTRDKNGVLIYVLLADRDVEIVADRGIAGVPQAEWEQCCRIMETHFREGLYREGAVAGITTAAKVMARYAPGGPDAGNELPNRPAVL
jgi:uncharacterized membrane protein